MSTEPEILAPPTTSGPQAKPELSPLWQQIHAFARHRLAIAGVVVLVILVIFCFLGPLFYHTDQVHTNLAEINRPPSGSHPLGTDNVGYDVLGRLMAGGQTSLEIAFGSCLIATIFGVMWGATAGYIGGAVDSVLMRIVDAALAVPVLFLLLFIAAFVTPSVKSLILILAAISWIYPARVVRGEALRLRTMQFVHASRLLGASRVRVILSHIIANCTGVIAVSVTFMMADAILSIAALSFLGLGLQPPTASWGAMLSDGVNYLLDGYWWLIYPAGIMIVLSVLALNLIGDALRDVTEHRARAWS
jgi:peptide/nickel transport system permease protein